MRNTRLERYAKSKGYEVYPQQKINGSLVDYCFSKGRYNIYTLIRDDLNDADLLYLSNVGKQWDKKLIFVQEIFNQQYCKYADNLDVSVSKLSELESAPFFGDEDPNDLVIDVVDKVAKMSWGSRAIFLLTACWKESVAIFIIGFFSAIFAKEYIFPIVAIAIKQFSAD